MSHCRPKITDNFVDVQENPWSLGPNVPRLDSKGNHRILLSGIQSTAPTILLCTSFHFTVLAEPIFRRKRDYYFGHCPSSWISNTVSWKLLLIPSSGVDVRKESLAVRPVFVYYILFTDNTMRCPINTKKATLMWLLFPTKDLAENTQRY
jgi:hypothetical protein